MRGLNPVAQKFNASFCGTGRRRWRSGSRHRTHDKSGSRKGLAYVCGYALLRMSADGMSRSTS